MPATVPAVLEIPMTTPACLGAMSMWLTENPPRANPASPSVALVAISPAVTERAIGMANRASPAPQNPTGNPQLSRLCPVLAGTPALRLQAVKCWKTGPTPKHHVLYMHVWRLQPEAIKHPPDTTCREVHECSMALTCGSQTQHIEECMLLVMRSVFQCLTVGFVRMLTYALAMRNTQRTRH